MRYCFGDYTLDTQRYELRRSGMVVPLRPKVFHVLQYLLAHRERVISKYELMEQVWPGQFISDETLSTCVTAARQAVGDSGQQQSAIQTRRGLGYRFVAAVVTRPDGMPALPETGDLTALMAPSSPRSLGERGGLASSDLPVSMTAAAALAPRGPVPTPPEDFLGLGEYRSVTVLAVLLNRVRIGRPDPESLHGGIQTIWRALQTEGQRYGGTLQQACADGVVLVFGVPLAQEDHAQRAVLAALGVQYHMQHQAVPLGWPAETPLTVGLGLHTGRMLLGLQPVAAQGPYTAVGDTIRLALRLARQAPPGRILLSAVTQRYVHHVVRVQPYTPEGLRRPPTARPVYTVLAPLPPHPALRTGPSGALSPFVGRQQELAVLQERMAQAMAGRGQVVGLVGEPGMGKSRLIYEWRQAVPLTEVTYLAARCLAYRTTTPYGLVGDLLRQLWTLTEADSVELIQATVAANLQALGLAPEDALPALGAVLGLPALAATYADIGAQDLRPRIVATLHQLYHRLSHHRPVLLEIEDVHWMDPTSQQYLEALVEQIAGLPLLLLVTFRPGYRPAWMDKSYATQLTLPPLNPTDSRCVLQAVLGATTLPDRMLQALLTRAEGNPFFLEELAQAVGEQATHQLPEHPPETVQAVLAARLDRLPPTVKSLLQVAAVIGMEVAWPLLHELAPGPADRLQAQLAHLQQAELLLVTHHASTPTYTFKHALTREAAYASLLRAQRQALHAHLVEAITTGGAHLPHVSLASLAHHAFQGQLWDKAVLYYQQVGTNAHQRAAFPEAVAAFKQTLEALAHLPTCGETQVLAIDLRLGLGAALNQLGAYTERLALLEEAEALARALADRLRLVRVLVQKTHVCRITGDGGRALEAGRQALTLATVLGDTPLQAQAAHTLAQAYHVFGDFHHAAFLFRQNVEAADQTPALPSIGRIESRAWLARTLSILGGFAEGRRHAEAALRLAATEGRGATPIVAHGCAGLLYLAQGNLARAISIFEQGLALCRAADNLDWWRGMSAGLGTAYVLQGRLTAGCTLLEEVRNENTRVSAPRSHVYARLSDAYRLMGHGAPAVQYARQALELARHQHDREGEVRALYQLGAALAVESSTQAAQVEVTYRHARRLAAAWGLRPLFAHCYQGLGQWYAQTGRAARARTALTTALDLYRTMDMPFYLHQAEAALAEGAG